MFRKPKSGYVLSLLAALFVVTVQACNDQLPTTPEVGSSSVMTQAPRPEFDKEPSLGNTIKTITQTLSCLLPDTVAVDIGPDGGTVTLGTSSLVIPKHALTQLTHIVMVPLPGTSPAVAFFPEGLQFATNAQPTLTFDTQCIGNPWNAEIVYTDDLGKIKEHKDTWWPNSHSVSAKIGHFSRYAVAW